MFSPSHFLVTSTQDDTPSTLVILPPGTTLGPLPQAKTLTPGCSTSSTPIPPEFPARPMVSSSTFGMPGTSTRNASNSSPVSSSIQQSSKPSTSDLTFLEIPASTSKSSRVGKVLQKAYLTSDSDPILSPDSSGFSRSFLARKRCQKRALYDPTRRLAASLVSRSIRCQLDTE
ncbi:hypothetical protein J6590_042949 [Homalodisca vitripennis]|nr:hypothetical protein J6590_042949 [Homalodisca vitripennis]